MSPEIHNKILTKLTDIDAKIGIILTKLEYIEKDISEHEQRIDKLEKRVGRLEIYHAKVEVRSDQFATNWKHVWALVVALIASIASIVMSMRK